MIAALICLGLTFTKNTNAQNTCRATTGNWGNPVTWSSCGGTIPQDGDVVVVPDNVNLTVDAANQYDANGSAPFLTIYVGEDDGDTDGANISFAGKLNLKEGSTLIVYEYSTTTANGPGNSEKIRWWDDGGSNVATLSGGGTAFTGPVTVTDGVVTGGTPLPVEFLYIKTTGTNQTVTVNWATIIEENNSFFTIERSQNGQFGWEAIGTVGGAGNSNNVITYRFIDESPLSNTSYYRIKQTDYDGQYDYSKIVANTQIMSSSVFPNPATSVLNITGDEHEIETVRIFNNIGEEIEIDHKISSISNQHKKLNVNGVSPGIYFVVTSNTKHTIYIR